MKNLALHLTFFSFFFSLFFLINVICRRTRGVYRTGCRSFPSLFNILWNRYLRPSMKFHNSIQTLLNLHLFIYLRIFLIRFSQSPNAGIQNAQLFENSVLEYKRNQILLNLARSIFEEQNNLECLVKKIMKEARDLLKCERCAVFLVDLECCEAVRGFSFFTTFHTI